MIVKFRVGELENQVEAHLRRATREKREAQLRSDRRKKREGHQRSGRGTREKPEGVNLVFPRLLSRTQKLEGNNTRFLVLLSEMEQAYLRKGTSEGARDPNWLSPCGS
jgi:hypothetical protein